LNTLKDDQRDLINRARAGEASAFQRLAQRHAAHLWRSALVLGGDGHWAEDLVQETLIEAWRCLPRFDGRCQLSTWLYGILRHRFLKGRRRARNVTASAPDALVRMPSAGPMPDCAAEASEDALRIRHAVASLPEEHRLVVELRFFAGATLDEIAATLGCPLGTVKSRLHNSLTKLRQMNLAVNLFTSPGESQVKMP
jgi:RNA polymerase sigma-70 factor, ECF subfamily